MKSLIVFGFLAVLTPSWAEEPETGEQAAEQALQATVPATAGGAGQLMGELQLRPSFGYGIGQTKSENIATLGVKLGADTSLDYTQYFNMNVSDPTGSTSGGLVGDDGFLRFRLRNVWKNVAGDLSLDYESRLYMPTNYARIPSGFQTMWRNYVSLTKKITSKVAITVQEIPIFYGFNRAGDTGDGIRRPSSSTVFENRVYIIPSWDITSKLNFSLPILLGMSFKHSIPGALDRSYLAMIWPELMYQVGPKTSIGLSYYSESFVNAQNVVDVSAGLATGTGQLVFAQTL